VWIFHQISSGKAARGSIAEDRLWSICLPRMPWQGEFPEHVATIIAMIDRYAESAIGDRHYFCDQPYALPPGKPVR
jgi:hypothetical protein